MISAANFVFPVIFNIGQIICITTDSSYLTTTMLLLVNGYVSVIGVLGATIWASGTAQAQAPHRAQMHGGGGDGPAGLSHGRNLSSSERTYTPFMNRGAVNSPVLDISEHSTYRIPHDGDHEKGFGNIGGCEVTELR